MPRALLTESHYDAPLPLWRHNEDHVILTICHGDRSTQWLRFSLSVDRAGRKLCLLTIPRDWSLISNRYPFTMFHVRSSQPRWCEEEDWFTQKLLTIRVAAPKQPSALEQVSEENTMVPIHLSHTVPRRVVWPGCRKLKKPYVWITYHQTTIIYTAICFKILRRSQKKLTRSSAAYMRMSRPEIRAFAQSSNLSRQPNVVQIQDPF